MFGKPHYQNQCTIYNMGDAQELTILNNAKNILSVIEQINNNLQFH